MEHPSNNIAGPCNGSGLKNPAASCKESSIPMERKHTYSRSLTPKHHDYDCIQRYRSSRASEPSRNALAWDSTTILIFAFACIVFGQEQYSWKPEDSTAVFMDSGSGFTFCYPENWIIKKRQTDKPNKTCLWLELFDCDFNNPINKGLDKIEHEYY